MELYKIENLTFSYPGIEKKALDNISLSIGKGTFTIVCGATGSGKTTLLKMLKNEIRPTGVFSGNILFKGIDLTSLSCRESASLMGYVLQNPEEQIVTDKVWHELAFGLENLGISNDEMRRRVAETAAYFGMEEWFERPTSTLSGGEKQLLNLASVMTMNPEVLILDEPTAQLDPIAASEFMATVNKLNKDLGLTVIMTEHRLEEGISYADNIIVMKEGRVIDKGDTKEVIRRISDKRLINAMPSSVQICYWLNDKKELPLNVREGRRLIEKNYSGEIKELKTFCCEEGNKSFAVEVNNICFRYGRNENNVVNKLSFSVKEGEAFCILGGNGAGKSTLLSLIAGLNKPYEGIIKLYGKKLKDFNTADLYNGVVALLPQDVKTLFLEYTVREELQDVKCDISKLPFDITHLLDKHPYDLSGGEQQLVGLAKVLAVNPGILLLDEPTKGLDSEYKNILTEIIYALKKLGKTVICVTHDIEFAAKCGDRCALLFRGEITSVDETRPFFNSMNFYTTAVNKMTKGIYNEIITVEQAVEILKLNEKREK